MMPSDAISRWDRLVTPLANVLDLAFGCHHSHLSRVFTLKGRSYKVCCDCGKDFDYSLQKMSIVRPRRVRPALGHLRIRHS